MFIYVRTNLHMYMCPVSSVCHSNNKSVVSEEEQLELSILPISIISQQKCILCIVSGEGKFVS